MLVMNYALGIMIVCVFTTTITMIGAHLPTRWFEKEHAFFDEHPFERGGAFYEDTFAISAWKDSLPDLGNMVNGVFSKSKLGYRPSVAFLKKFLTETRRSETVHWIEGVAGLPFFAFNPTPVGFAVCVTYFVINLPFIVVQRYNRPRIKRLIDAMERREHQESGYRVIVEKEGYAG